MKSLPWPIRALDFEASSPNEGGYPIEVGLALWRGPDRPIDVWSSLIAPAPSWIESGLWEDRTVQVHGIARDDLAAGLTVTEVAGRLNALAGSAKVLTDSPTHDGYWLDRLYRAADRRPSFELVHVDTLIDRLDYEARVRLWRWQAKASPRHRASDDAERHMKGFARAIKVASTVTRHDLSELGEL